MLEYSQRRQRQHPPLVTELQATLVKITARWGKSYQQCRTYLRTLPMILRKMNAIPGRKFVIPNYGN